ncbi:methyltransferase domain-containing protein [Reichenbachiella carrageenanivorans]|uniref:Methyltransferase domain-containing protein n=1 Tax=Reichenbachiella carrageenanivorans TaxID=2979869 RepID=A0ABY6D2Q5_9BACT|nr:methyltransferase domain-containing protein [Reichenbachiella carrageenanivorans]UXX80184.1 methyltransferase domain-containing protein [Reichenbachiella carrageenanivorans]
MFEFLNQRSLKEEIMDDFYCQGEVVDQTLRELHQINTYLGGDQLSLNAIKKLLIKHPKDSYEIVDLGCGGGDTLKRFAKWGKRHHQHLQLLGIDANAYIVDYALKNCRKYPNISFSADNLLSSQFRNKTFDIAHASLFLHHLQDEEIIVLLKQLIDQARVGVVINDLHRHWLSYAFTKHLITRWSKSEMVKYDATLSVARAFTRSELEKYMKWANIKNYSLTWQWAFRWELIIWK